MHAIELARDAVLQGYRRLLVVGGDGTVNEALSGIHAQTATSLDQLAFASAGGGTGDDWLRTLGMPRRVRDLAAVIAAGRTRAVDVGLVKCSSHQREVKRHFINMAGSGIDAMIAEERKAEHAGALTCLLAMGRVAFQCRGSMASITGDGHDVVARVMAVLVNLGRYGGRGMKIAPQAELDDGLFDTMIVEHMPPWRIALNSYRLFNGTLCASSAVKCRRLSAVAVSGSPAMLVQADGEVIGTTPAHFSILPRALRVLVPAGGHDGR